MKFTNRMGISKTVVILAAFIAGISVTHAEISSEWVEGMNSRARLVAGTVESGNLAGLEITLTEGWKTYWRNPGDGGVAPEFSWQGSENVRDIHVLFPAPIRYRDDYGTSIGYKRSVVFPVKFVPIDASKPLTLRVSIDYAVCEALCIPAHASIALRLPGSVSLGPSIRLLDGMASVPSSRNDSDAQIVSLEKISDPNLMFDVMFPGKPDSADVFVEGPENWFLPAPEEVAREETGSSTLIKYSLDLSSLPRATDIQGNDLLFTITGGGRPVEQVWRLQ